MFLKDMLIISVTALTLSHNPVSAETGKLQKIYEMYGEYRKEFPEVEDITPSKAMKLYNEGKVVFVDAREREEMEISMLPGAISKEEFLKDPKRYDSKKIVAYCTIGFRSGKFAGEMAERKIDVLNLKGSILAWTLEGGKVFHEDKATKQIHVYGKKWNIAPEDYEVVMFGFFRRLF